MPICRHVYMPVCRINGCGSGVDLVIPGDRKYRLSEIPDVTIQPTVPGVLANYCALRLYN